MVVFGKCFLIVCRKCFVVKGVTKNPTKLSTVNKTVYNVWLINFFKLSSFGKLFFSPHHRKPSTSTASIPSGSKNTPADKPRTPATESKSRATTPQSAKQKGTSSVADGSSTKQVAKTSNPEKTSKKAATKKDPAPKSAAPENQCDTGRSEQKPTLGECDNGEKESVAKETIEADKPDSRAETCSAEPEPSGESAGGASEPMEAEGVANRKEENLVPVDSVDGEPSAEGPSESQPSTSTLEIPAAETQTVEQGTHSLG